MHAELFSVIKMRTSNVFLTGAHRSEGPAQVFLLTLTWLVAAFRDLSTKEREDITLCSDNMCHLDNLKVAKKPLPLPGIIANYELYVLYTCTSST